MKGTQTPTHSDKNSDKVPFLGDLSADKFRHYLVFILLRALQKSSSVKTYLGAEN
jgi:hypothetical protein